MYRGHVERQRFLRTKRAAIKVQAAARGYRQRVAYLAARGRLIKLQAAWRGFSGHKAFLRSKAAAVSMQSHFRGRQARLHVKAVRAAIAVQSVYRGHVERCRYLSKRRVVVFLQSCIRKYLFFKKCLKSAIIAQTLWRGIRSRRLYLSTLHSVRVVQGFWRGCQDRKRLFVACRDLAARSRVLRKRIQDTRRMVQDHMKLSNRTKAGLDVLLKSASITTTMKAISSLEVSSRWSDVCACCIADLGAIEKLYLVLRSCNRSKPHVELARSCLRTIANFAAYGERFRAAVSVLPVAAEALCELIQNLRDTDEECVLKAVGLMSYIAQDREQAMRISQLSGVDGQPAPVQRLNLTMVSLKRRGGAKPAPTPQLHSAGPAVVRRGAAACSPSLMLELQALLRRVG